MKRVSAILAAGFLVAVFSGCSGGGGDSSPAPTTGSLTVTGAPTVGNAFTAPALKAARAATLISGTPVSVKLKAYKVYLAQNADCSNPVLVQDKTTTADYQELMTKPTLFSADSVAAGTYNCMILKVSDIFKFTPDATAQTASGGVCVANQEVNFDILKVESPAENWLDIETGGTVAGDGAIGASVEQIVFLFASTDPTAVTANNNLIHPHQMGQILNPIVIKPGQNTKSAFVFDTTNRMSVIPTVNGDFCWLEGFTAQFVTQ